MVGSKKGKGKKKVRGDQVRQKIWPRREMTKESDSEKGTKMMGRNKGYPRRIEVLSLRERGTEFISSPTRSKTAAQAALMKWQDAKKGENDKVNMRRERNVRNENSEKAGESKEKNRLKTLQALCKMQDGWLLHNSSGND
jgi:hypothetical protein